MGTTRSILAVAVLLVLAGCTAPFAVGAENADVTDTLDAEATDAADPVVGQASGDTAAAGSVIAVSATGSAAAEADLAVVRLSVSATEDSAEAARAAVAADSERMREGLADAGVSDDAVRTASYAIYPQYDYRSEEQELIGYRAVHAYVVEVAPERAGAVVDAAVGSGATTVDGVTFTLAEETRADLRAQALKEAMTVARADAIAVADAADLSLVGVREASVVADGGDDPVFRAEDSAGDSTVFEPGPVTVTATVQVSYDAN